MPKILNWDALECDYIDVREGGKVKWHLRDDVPMERMAAFLVLQQRLQSFAEATQRGDLAQASEAEQQEIIADFATINDDLAHFVGDLIRHSYPEVTDEEVAKISFQRRIELAMAFFSQAGDSLSKQQPSVPAAKKAQTTRRR